MLLCACVCARLFFSRTFTHTTPARARLCLARACTHTRARALATRTTLSCSLRASVYADYHCMAIARADCLCRSVCVCVCACALLYLRLCACASVCGSDPAIHWRTHAQHARTCTLVCCTHARARTHTRHSYNSLILSLHARAYVDYNRMAIARADGIKKILSAMNTHRTDPTVIWRGSSLIRTLAEDGA